MADSDTIFALATPPGRSALAVFRISGRKSIPVAELLTQRKASSPRTAALRGLFDPSSNAKLDDALVTIFPGPGSFTGEDCVELSVHGGRSVVSSITGVLSGLDGVRPAEPGEFTRRAFRAGKFDLSQAEAVADLIDSETEFQQRQAVRLLNGGLGAACDGWRRQLLEISAHLESALDFSDEGDVEALNPDVLRRLATGLADDMGRHLSLGRRSHKIRNGFTVLIAGPPNAGKSTLFNKIAGSELAIVTEHAGTTRDLLKADLNLEGILVTLIDSAGLRESSDPVERIGIERAQAAASNADLILSLAPGGEQHAALASERCLKVWSKSDAYPAPSGSLAVSANDSDSIQSLISRIRQEALSVVGDGTDGLLTRQRHIDAIDGALAALERFDSLVEQGRIELAAEECRLANLQLGSLTGAFATEELLGEIFQRFCIGK